MAIIKCKMCGGDLNVIAGETIAECEYCGSKQTIPSADNEKKLTLFSRANRLRFGCEFDKAAGVYEAIVADFSEEAEAYWGLVLCKYGIEYVDDPATGKKIPTCHRSSFDSVMDDANFEMACEYADGLARRLYRDEAKQIEGIRKGIIEVSGKEEPYDIFICYKETTELGDRTLDSVLAQDVYDALTAKGYRVFFSRITLEDKLGQEYEPYIFAALNSAKIMLAFGTDYEYYNAVWVKNEWSRYLQLMTQDKSKHLIPCYKGIDAYDMPKEFAKLQAQDMGKVGAVQDLLRGVEKLLPRVEKGPVSQQSVVQGNIQMERIWSRATAYLLEGNWDRADECCERILEMDPNNTNAYLGKLLAALRATQLEKLKNCQNTFENNENYKIIQQSGDSKLKKELADVNVFIKERNEAEITRKAELARVNAEARSKKAKALRKRICNIAVFLAIAAVVVMISYPIYMAMPEQMYVYTENNNGTIVISGKESRKNDFGGEITLPDTIWGKTVAGVGTKAFMGFNDLTGIIIPEGVTSIGASAFEGCTGLTTITIPEGVTSIGASAFEGCTGLTTITIPEGVTSIGASAFEGCTGLTSITISEGVTSIGDSAFKGCTSLSSITIPEGVTSLGSSAFEGCTGLASITISEGVTSIGDSAFEGCSRLGSISIPNTVFDIGESAFQSCTSLTDITLSDNVNSISTRMFLNCTALTDITIPGSAVNIGNNAFQDCEALTTVTISEGVASIGEQAFAYCAGLVRVTIPNSLTSIKMYAFYKCPNLTDITYFGTTGEWRHIDKSVWFPESNYTIYCSNGELKG